MGSRLATQSAAARESFASTRISHGMIRYRNTNADSAQVGQLHSGTSGAIQAWVSVAVATAPAAANATGGAPGSKK